MAGCSAVTALAEATAAARESAKQATVATPAAVTEAMSNPAAVTVAMTATAKQVAICPASSNSSQKAVVMPALGSALTAALPAVETLLTMTF